MTYKKYKQGNHKEKQQDTMNVLFKKLKKGVKALYSSNKWRKYLETISKFHNYSHKNILLTKLQNSNPFLVSAHKKWKTKFKRQVRKQENSM